MGKSKRDATTPRRRVSMTKKRTFDRTIAKVISRPNSAVTSTNPSIANIRVVVRVRPPNLREQDENHRCVVKVVDEQMLVFDPKEETQGFFFHGTQQKGRDFLKKANKDMKFVFDKVFPQESVTEEVFKNTTYTLINSLMSGFNCSVFAYGATGAGKTFTMTGNTSNPGVTFLTMTELFEKKEELSQERDFEIGITYLEVYNELVKDLLNPGPPLNLREDAKYGVTVAGIKVYEIKKPDELFSLLEQGNKNRTQHPTDANSESSRSHAVFQVYLKMTMKGTKEIRTAKLSMIDLAGSERGSATGFAGARFTEGANINKSLLALGNCINSLADGLRHVPYRDSKLTRLLKDSLGGNCQTVMIANVSPSSLSFEDTYNTLKYATRAKKIKSAAKRNVVSVEMHVGHYVKLVEELRAEVARLKTEATERARVAETTESGGEEEATERGGKGEEVGRLKEEVARIKEELLMRDNEVEKFRGECDRMRGLLERGIKGHDGVVAEGDVEAIEEIKQLLLEKRECLERRSQLEKSESTTILRRLLKEEIDSRISVSAADSTEKVEAHRRVRAAIERFRRKESALKENIEDVGGRSSEVDKRLREIARERPHLKRQLDAELMDLKNLKLKHQVEHERKTIELLLDDREVNSTLVGKMSTALRSFYQLLQGHQLLTPDIVEQYRDVGAALRGRRNVKWMEEGEERERDEGEKEDSGVGSATSVPLSDGGSNRSACVKRKMEDAGTADAEVLDRTFSLPTTAAASSTTAAPGKGLKAATGGQTRDQIVSKAALKAVPMKRLANQRRDLKSGFRRPFETNTMTAARALVSAKINSAAFRGTSKTPTKELAARPRFRS